MHRLHLWIWKGRQGHHGTPWDPMGKWMKHLLQYIYIYILLLSLFLLLVLLLYIDLYYTLNFELCREHVSSELPDWHRCQMVSGNIKRDQATKHPTDKLYIPMFKPRRLPRTRLPGCRRTGDTWDTSYGILRQLPGSSMTKMHADAGLTETYRNKTLKDTESNLHHYSSLYTGVQAILHFSWPKGKNIGTSSKGTLAETNCNSSSSPLLRILP